MVALYVLLGFILLLIIDAVVLRAEKKLHPAFVRGYDVEEHVVYNKLNVMVPVDLFISKAHTWAKEISKGKVKVGIDEFILKSLGQVQILNTAITGSIVKEGEVIFEAVTDGKKIKFRSPVSGIIETINNDVFNRNIEDPYGEDWGMIIKTYNFDQNISKMKFNEEVVEWMKSELIRLKEFLSISFAHPQLAGVTMYDGGTIVEGIISKMDDTVVVKYEKEFLSM